MALAAARRANVSPFLSVLTFKTLYNSAAPSYFLYDRFSRRFHALLIGKTKL